MRKEQACVGFFGEYTVYIFRTLRKNPVFLLECKDKFSVIVDMFKVEPVKWIYKKSKVSNIKDICKSLSDEFYNAQNDITKNWTNYEAMVFLWNGINVKYPIKED